MTGPSRSRHHPGGLLVLAAVGIGVLAAVSIPVAVAAVVLGVGAVSVRRRPAWTAVIAIVALTAPVFVDVEQRSIRALSLFSRPGVHERLTLHIAIVVVPAAFIMVARSGRLRTRLLSTPESGLVALLVAWLTVSALVGQMTHANTLGLAYYVQTAVPLLAFFVGAQRPVPAPVVMRTVIVTTLTVICAVLVSVVLVDGLGGTFFDATARLAWALPQYRSYFPGIVAVAVAFAVAGFHASWRMSLALLVAVTALMPLMWSRAGVLVILSAGLISGALCTSGRGRAAFVVLFGIVVSIGLVGVIAEQGVIGTRLDASTHAGDLRRAELAHEGLRYVVDSPVLGRAFEPEWDVLSGGQDAEITRLFGSHNQFLEYGLRGGLPALLLFVVTLARTAVGLLRARASGRADTFESPPAGSLTLARTRESPPAGSPTLALTAFHAAMAAIVIAMTIGGMFQLYFTQPYTGSLLWFLIGMASATRVSSPDQLETCLDANAVQDARKSFIVDVADNSADGGGRMPV